MNREWKPGDVAMVNDTTHPEAPWKVAMCVAGKVPGIPETRWRIDTGEVWGSVSQARPLVVLDLNEQSINRVVEVLREKGLHLIADQITEQTSPPKPEEPQGLGAVVEDADGVLWVRAGKELQTPDHWRATSGENLVGWWATWDRITVVRILSAGVES